MLILFKKNENKQICDKKLVYETNQIPTHYQINTSTVYCIKKCL
jgi:hypothetical protein